MCVQVFLYSLFLYLLLVKTSTLGELAFTQSVALPASLGGSEAGGSFFIVMQLVLVLSVAYSLGLWNL